MKKIMTLAYQHSIVLEYRFHESGCFSLFGSLQVAIIANTVNRILIRVKMEHMNSGSKLHWRRRRKTDL